MSHAVPAVQPLNQQTQTQPAAQAPKTPQATTQQGTPQDSVTISSAAKQALAYNK